MKILFENKQLNEGPGAGYTIETKGYSLNGTIKSVKVSNLKENHYSAYAIDCDVDFTGEVDTYKASGYYAGTGEVNSLPITCSHIYIEVPGGTLNDWHIISDEDYENDNVNESTLNIEALLDLIKEDLLQGECSFTYGGGWSHATYDGQVTDDDWLSGVYYTDMKATIYLSNEEDIKKVDRMTQGYGYATLYAVGYENSYEDAFETEEEAIEYAKKHGYDEVRIVYDTEDWNGDVDSEYGDTVWTNDDVDESIEKKDGKTLPKDIQKAVLGLLRTSNTLFSEKNMPYATDDELVSVIDDFIKIKERVMSNRNNADAKPLTEDFDDDEKIQALAKYLNIDPSEITNIYDYEFETPEGDYYVVTEEEAEELAKEDIRNLYDDLGLESFTSSFRDWIIMNALDNDWFEEAVRESYEYYVEDIEDEASSMGYENRLIEEMHDHQVLSDDDFVVGEDGEPDLTTLNDDVDIDYLKEEFVDLLVENAGNAVDYCGDNYGWDWVAEMASQHNLIDLEEVVDQCIYEDGIAHFIARYDGEEIELENGLYAYRTN